MFVVCVCVKTIVTICWPERKYQNQHMGFVSVISHTSALEKGVLFRSPRGKTKLSLPGQGRHRPVVPAPARLVGPVPGNVPGPGAAPSPASQALLPPGNLAREGNYFTLMLCTCLREGNPSLKGGSPRFILTLTWGINTNLFKVSQSWPINQKNFFCLLLF